MKRKNKFFARISHFLTENIGVIILMLLYLLWGWYDGEFKNYLMYIFFVLYLTLLVYLPFKAIDIYQDTKKKLIPLVLACVTLISISIAYFNVPIKGFLGLIGILGVYYLIIIITRLVNK
jgi:hypothetical protein